MGTARGVVSMVRMAEHAQKADPLLQLEAAPEPAPRSKRGVWVRSRALSALRAAARGHEGEMAALLEELDTNAAGPGYGLDRAIALLARATIAAIDGRKPAAAEAFAAATREAASDGVDPDLLPALARRQGDVLVVTGAKRWQVSHAPVDESAFAVVIDARSHSGRVGKRSFSLKRRAVARRVLYVLLRRNGESVSKEELVREVWESEYRPVPHDVTLRQNVSVLRRLLAPTGIEIDFDDRGYRLLVPQRFAFIEEFRLAD
jgi:hypothetical protein